MEKINLEFIKQRRLELNLSSVYVAKQLGYKNSSAYWKKEKGLLKIKADKLPLLARILQCEIQNFFI